MYMYLILYEISGHAGNNSNLQSGCNYSPLLGGFYDYDNTINLL